MKFQYILYTIRFAFICTMGISTQGTIVDAKEPANQILVGGQDLTGTHPAYAAFLGPDGRLTKLSGDFPWTEGIINSVTINRSEVGIIGGQDLSGVQPAYAALVAPNGALTKLNGDFQMTIGEILSVAINDSGLGIIGGNEQTGGNQTPYAAFVAPDIAMTKLNDSIPSKGRIFAVAINRSGTGLIGGVDFVSGLNIYAALVEPNGHLHQLSISLEGEIRSVAINNLGAGIIAGRSFEGIHPAYAALVAPDGTPKELSGDFPPIGLIYSASINDSGIALIGGINILVHKAYAALVAPDGTLRSLSGDLPTPGTIDSVAINNSGAGVIGGFNSSNHLAYAALVAPDGTLTRLSGDFLSEPGYVYSVAIDRSGTALIGGGANSGTRSAFAALVAPNGTLTRLSGDIPSIGAIDSVAIDATPRSIGPYSSAMNAQLAAASIVETHLMIQSRLWNRDSQPNMIAALDDPNQIMPMKCAASPKRPRHTIWTAPFGNYLHIHSVGEIPSFTNQVVGIVAAYDHHFSSNLLFGGGLGYACNDIRYRESLGHGSVQEELSCLYTAYQINHFRLNATLWGGLYQLSNHRQTLYFILSKSHTHGWILSPHLEIAIPYILRKQDYSKQSIEPFVMCDYVNSWQRHFTEFGKSGLNLVIDGQYAALVQTELGLRFYEEWKSSRGTYLFEEKLSYINQAPIHFQKIDTFFIQSVSIFPIATGSSKIQNLGKIQLSGTFLPQNSSIPYTGFDLQAALGSSYQSYYADLRIGKNF